MIQELLYTSHEGRGLRQGGGGGYCTVLSTEGMASNLAASLEKLSGYKHPFDIHDPRSGQNPVNWRHAVIRVGGVAYHVLSRIADLKGEHTGRSNKLAHHVVLTQADQVPGGPTRLLSHPGFSRTSWDGKVELVHAVPRSTLPNDDLLPRVCRHWQAAGGDAGLGGHVADLLRSVPNPTVSVIFPLGADALALTDEVFSLLTPQQRWSTTFSTYYAAAPPISSCHLRFVLDGTADAELLRRDHRQMVVDLANPPSTLAETPLVAAARSGVRLKAQPDASRPRQTSVHPNRENSQAANEALIANQLQSLEPLPALADETFLPPIHSDGRGRGQFPSSSPKHYRANRQSTTPQKQKWKEKRVLAACCLISIGLCIGSIVVLVLTRGAGEEPVIVAEGNPSQEAPTNEETVAQATTPTHTVEAPSTQPSEDAVARDSPAEGEQPSDTTPAPENTSAGGAAVENAEQTSEEGRAPTGSAETEQPPEAPSAVPAETTITLLEGPRIPVLSHLAEPPTQEVVGKVGAPKGGIENCRLIGLEWVSDKWKVSSLGKETLQWISPSALEGAVKIPEGLGAGLRASLKLLCTFEVQDGKPVFSWNKKDTQLKIKGVPEKAAILNGLKWSVLRITANDRTHHYFGLSPSQPPATCKLFQSEPQPLLDTSLPAFDGKASPLRVDMAIESYPLSNTQQINSAGAVEFKYASDNGLDYIQFKIFISDTPDGTSALTCSHKLSYQTLVADGNEVNPVTRTSPDIGDAVKQMQHLSDGREKQIKTLEEEIKTLRVNSDEWTNTFNRLTLLRSHREKLEARIPALTSFEQTYTTLRDGVATVTLKIIYTDPDSKKEIIVPVLSKDAPIGQSP